MPRSMKTRDDKQMTWDMFWSIFFFLFAAFVFIFFVSAYTVLYGQNCFIPKKADVIIIPGAKTGSLSLYYRCDKALELYKEGFADKIITTGGQGEDEATTEAKDAAEYLIHKGIDKNDIIEENQSKNTWQNLAYAKDIMFWNGFQSAIIVTSDFHLYRSMALADKLKMNCSGAPSKVYEPDRLQHTVREILAVIKYACLNSF